MVCVSECVTWKEITFEFGAQVKSFVSVCFVYSYVLWVLVRLYTSKKSVLFIHVCHYVVISNIV